MCNCVCRCVSDRILEAFVWEQKEQHPAHSPSADLAPQGELGKTALQTCLRLDSDGDSCITCCIFSDLVVFAGLWLLGEIFRDAFWLVKRAYLMWESLTDSEHTALPCPRGKDCHSSLPSAQGPAPRSSPHPAHPTCSPSSSSLPTASWHFPSALLSWGAGGTRYFSSPCSSGCHPQAWGERDACGPMRAAGPGRRTQREGGNSPGL